MSSYRRAVHHSSARRRALHMVRRHAWQFHGAGVEDAVRNLPLPGINAVPAIRRALDKLAVSLYIPGPLVLDYDDTQLTPAVAPEPVCLCTHPRSTHNANGLCIALPGVLGCGCLGWSEVRPAGVPEILPAQCDECGHAHVSGVKCVEDTFGSFMCGCMG